METKKKKNGLTRALAVILALSLVIGGGTFAYLQDSTDPVENTFATNHNDVELNETTGEDYEIVPGTSQDKDPTITATYTLDSYLFVKVTDATEDLVTWYIANGWTALADATDEDAGVYVYYMLLEENYDSQSSDWEQVSGGTYDGWYTYTDSNGVTYYYDAENEEYVAIISVLKDDKVYYDASITNEQMEEAGDDISLTFQAYIVQAQLSDDADPADLVTAYGVATTGATTYIVGATYVGLTYGATDDSGEEITLATQLANAIASASAGETMVIVLPSESMYDIGAISIETTALTAALATQDESNQEIAANIVIDLNSRTLKLTDVDNAQTGYAVSVANGDNLTLINGTIEEESILNSESALFYVKEDSSLTLENVTVENTDASVVYVSQKASVVNIVDSTISTTGVYCVSTNANSTDNYGVTINIENSVLTSTGASDGDECAVLLNVPGTLNISDSTITGGRQGVVVRAGTANITDSTIATANSYTGSNRSLRQGTSGEADATKIWGSGNEVAVAALVVGNYSSTAYDDEATVTLNNVTLKVADATADAGVSNAPQIFVASYSGSSYSSTTTLNIINAVGTYDINSTTLCSGTTNINYASYYAENATYVTLTGSDNSELASALTTALAAAKSDETTVVVLPEDGDVSVAASALQTAVTNTAVIDLNGNTLAVTEGTSVTLSDGDDLTIANGTLERNEMGSPVTSAFAITSGSSLTLENVTATTDGALLYPRGDAAEVNVIDSNITSTGSYPISTNAATSENYNVVITVEDSTVYGAACAILTNVPCTVNVSNSTLTGETQTVIIRAGTATIENSVLINTLSADEQYSGSSMWTYFDTHSWLSGNGVSVAVLTIGDPLGTSYVGGANVTLTNVDCQYESGDNTRGVYITGSSNYGSTLTYDSSCDLGKIVVGAEDYVTVTVSDAE